MSSQNIINLKSFPFIKLFSSLLIIFGAIIAYILASQPEMMWLQIGGVQWNIILCIPPFLSGLVLLLYTFITHYNVKISDEGEKLLIKSRRLEISFSKQEVQAVKVRDAGKFYIWLVFMFINFYFVYYGIECGVFWFANHYAGSFELILFPLLLIWIGGLILVLFPRKLLIILLKDKAILQKINHLPKDRSVERLMDDVFEFSSPENVNYNKTNQYQHRLILGVISILIFTITSFMVEIDGIVQPLHDLGIFIPIFLLMFGVLMVSSALSTGIKQYAEIKEKSIKIEEKTLLSFFSGNNYNWIRSEENLKKSELSLKSFRTLTKFDYAMIFVIFGQAAFLGFKFVSPVYLPYFDIFDLLIGLLILVVLFFYQFEIVSKLSLPISSEFKFPREILISDSLVDDPENEKRSTKISIKERITTYFKDFKDLLKSDFKPQIIKIGITYIVSILVLTLSFFMLGFVLFIFI
jgi:hypothetical protein